MFFKKREKPAPAQEPQKLLGEFSRITLYEWFATQAQRDCLQQLGERTFLSYSRDIDIFTQLYRMGRVDADLLRRLLDYFSTYEIEEIQVDALPELNDEPGLDRFARAHCKAYPSKAGKWASYGQTEKFYYIMEQTGAPTAKPLTDETKIDEHRLMAMSVNPIKPEDEQLARQLVKIFREHQGFDEREPHVLEIKNKIDDIRRRKMVFYRAKVLATDENLLMNSRFMEALFDLAKVFTMMR